MPKIDATVVIPVLNSENTIAKCLNSIRMNVTKYNYEIIVVDAGSIDHTVEIAEYYADKVLQGKPFTINRNEGIKNAQGEIICFTDSDCSVPENWLDGLIDGLKELNEKDPKIAGVGGPNTPVLDKPSSIELAISYAMRSPLVSFKARNTAVYSGYREVTHNPPMNSACFKIILDEIGGFVEESGYPEDLDLDARIIKHGYKLYYLPEVLVFHKHKSNLEAFIRQMRDFGMKRCRVNRQHRHIARLYHYGPMVLCLMLLSPLFFIPLTMALTNALFVSIKDRVFKLFFPLVRLTVDFYLYYGFGEIKAIMETIT
ncbi:MAG: glycosyltransferase [Dehalococcoidales bacterium]|nr:glycosyltransferase [Dehalococcoidales bacterium]